MRRTETHYRPYRPRHAAGRRIAETALRHAVSSSYSQDATQFTIGLEEELFVVDAESFDCIGEMPPAFHQDAEAVLGGTSNARSLPQ